MRIIKYANRKLYDRDQHGYVTLSDVIEKIKEGSTLNVLDKQSGLDITLDVLKSLLPLNNNLTQDVIYDILRKG